METYLAIASRREVRQYADRPVPEELRNRILDAGRGAGSSVNRQQWRFVLIEARDVLDRVAELVYAPSNLHGADFAIAVAVYGKGPTHFDAGRAAQNMMLAAWDAGVGSCPNGMPDREPVRQALGLDEGEEVVTILSLGYPARPIDATRHTPEEWIARANRKAFDEVVVRR
jgi:nitroreductase